MKSDTNNFPALKRHEKPYYIPYIPIVKQITRAKLLDRMNEKYDSMRRSEFIPLNQKNLNYSYASLSINHHLNPIAEADDSEKNASGLIFESFNNQTINSPIAYDFRAYSVKSRTNPGIKLKSFGLESLKKSANYQEINKTKERLAFRNQPVSSKALEEALTESSSIVLDNISLIRFPQGGERLIKHKQPTYSPRYSKRFQG